MSTAETLLQTPLYRWHVDNGGRMVDFAGWSMPVQYGGIMDEHHQTRNSVGLFDVSHMGRLYFSGEGVDQFLDRLTTRRIAGVDCGRIRYSLMTNEQGGILDDVLVYHLPDAEGDPFHMMVVNASNRAKIVQWIEQNLDGTGIEMKDRTVQTAMIAVQGPQANALVAGLANTNPDDMAYYTGTTAQMGEASVVLSRTGYTGEDGCEIICESGDALAIWESIMLKAKAIDGGASGLAARDTLRLEAGMPLYGHELSESINPAQADLKFAIQMKDRDFVGKQAILDARKDATLPVRVGLELEGRRAAREECEIFHHDAKVGVVTSGTYAPTLQKSLSMAYVNREAAEVGTEVVVDIRGKQHPARVVALPFYQRPQ